MITYAEALSLFINAAHPVVATERIPTLYAHDRVLAESIVSHIEVPAFDNSQMDGYAVRAEDLAEASEENPVCLSVSDRIPAGHVGATLKSKTCARIFTGAPIPAGADTVVPQEDVTVTDAGVIFSQSVKAGAWVRHQGCDIARDTVVVHQGERLTPARLGLVASCGVNYVTVYRHLRVALFCSGSELTMPGDPLPAGGIYNSNRYTLRSLLQSLDCEVTDIGVVEDTLEKTIEAFNRASLTADLIVSSGGMSVGEEDHIRPAVQALGELNLWRVALKPGKPVALGQVNGVAFIGLPGNPVSSFVTFLMLARPFILRSQGVSDVVAHPIMCRSDFSWKGGAREEFIRVRRNERGGLDIFRTQNSQVLTSCAWADGLVHVASGATINAGDVVTYYQFGELFRCD